MLFGVMVDAKASKCTDLHVTIKKFSGGYVPNPMFGSGYGAPPQTPYPWQSGAAVRLTQGLSRPPQCLFAVDATARDQRRSPWFSECEL